MVDTRSVSRLDFNLLGTAVLLAVIGCILIYSATWAAQDAAILHRQIIWLTLGLALSMVFVFVDYHVFLDISGILWGIGVALLLYLWLWGKATANVHSWIHIGPLQFQPSEFAKIFTALALAKYFESNDRAYLDLKGLLMVGATIGIPVALIVIQPDFGTAATYFPLVAAAMFFGGIKPRFWLIAILIVLIALPTAWFFLLKPYQQERIKTFLDPERDPLGSGYQVMQSKIAIGSGGITGKGFREGTQASLEFLPARHTDFIFAVLGEEFGFIGVFVVLGLYLFLLVQCLQVAREARDRSGAFLVICLVSFIVFHVFINVAMQIGLVPTTGIPLPFLSYGGSSTLMFLFSIALILNVDLRKLVNV